MTACYVANILSIMRGAEIFVVYGIVCVIDVLFRRGICVIPRSLSPPCILFSHGMTQVFGVIRFLHYRYQYVIHIQLQWHRSELNVLTLISLLLQIVIKM